MRQYVYGRYIDEPLTLDRNLNGDNTATGAGDQRLFYHQNTLYSTFALTDSAGSVVEGYQYDAYGRQTVFAPGTNGVVDFGGDDVVTPDGASSLGNPYLFTGRRLDAETGLYHYRARYLNTAQGRFISRDPIGSWVETLSLGNPYSYVGNNPTNYQDPAGRDKIDMTFGTSDMSYYDRTWAGFPTITRDIDHMIEKIDAALRKEIDPKGECMDCLRVLTVLGHGMIGGIVMGGAEGYGTASGFTPQLYDGLVKLSEYFCEDGEIILKECKAGRGSGSQATMDKVAGLTGVPASGPKGRYYPCPVGGFSFEGWTKGYPERPVPSGANPPKVKPPSSPKPDQPWSRMAAGPLAGL